MGTPNRVRQEQIIVSPNTATMADLGKGKHFGFCYCPFCQKQAVVAGPKTGWGLAWIYEACEHSQGIAAGHGFDITILFRGVPK